MSTTVSLPSRGEIWKDNNTEVQISDFHKGNVMFKYIKESSGLEGFTATMRIEAFIERYTEIDVFEAQNQRVKSDDVWWWRRGRGRTVRVLSVLNNVVTFAYNTEDEDYSALSQDEFVAQYTNTIIKPVDTVDISGWPTHALVQYSATEQLHFWSFTDADETIDSPRTGNAFFRVPIDWTQATWEVEPS